MRKELPKFVIVTLLALPFIVFAAAVVAVMLWSGREMEQMVSLPVSTVFSGDTYLVAAAFLISFIAEVGLLTWTIRLYEHKAVSFENLSREQEQGAQLLVRRDLELSRANEQLHKLDEVKSNFITVVAHQLRTPLSGIKWTLNLLLKGDLGTLSSEQQDFLLKAYESNDRMISLVNDLLSADRIESGKIRYQFASVSLLEVIDAAFFEISPIATAKGVAIQFDNRPAEFPLVRADAEQIRAVLQNLLENAIKYSRAGGAVRLALSTANGEASVSIKDDGIGIPKEQQKDIFDRFFRASNAVKVETEGTGLGLFIVKSIVERHGGRIWFESEEGKGVTFYFTLPVYKQSA